MRIHNSKLLPHIYGFSIGNWNPAFAGHSPFVLWTAPLRHVLLSILQIRIDHVHSPLVIDTSLRCNWISYLMHVTYIICSLIEQRLGELKIEWLVVDAWIARSHTSPYYMVRHVLWATIYLLSPSSEVSSIDIWVNLPECFSSSVGSFTSTLNVRVEGTSDLRGMWATRSTPSNVEEQRN